MTNETLEKAQVIIETASHLFEDDILVQNILRGSEASSADSVRDIVNRLLAVKPSNRNKQEVYQAAIIELTQVLRQSSYA